MLMDIIIEALMNMDDETLDSVLESCDAEEIDFIDAAIEMKMADRNNLRVRQYTKTMRNLRKDDNVTHKTPNGNIEYNKTTNTVYKPGGTITPPSTKTFNNKTDAKNAFVKSVKRETKRKMINDKVCDVLVEKKFATGSPVDKAVDFILYKDLSDNPVSRAASAAKKSAASKAVNKVRNAADKLENRYVDKATNNG